MVVSEPDQRYGPGVLKKTPTTVGGDPGEPRGQQYYLGPLLPHSVRTCVLCTAIFIFCSCCNLGGRVATWLTAPRTASIAYMKYLAIEQPGRPLLPCDHAEDETWSPYPQPQATPLQSHIPCVFNSWCELSKINVDTNKSIFGTGSKLPRGDLHRTLKEVQPRLDDWRAQLPECLTLENSSVPQAFSLQ